jgi:hypothetical protein
LKPSLLFPFDRWISKGALRLLYYPRGRERCEGDSPFFLKELTFFVSISNIWDAGFDVSEAVVGCPA